MDTPSNPAVLSTPPQEVSAPISRRRLPVIHLLVVLIFIVGLGVGLVALNLSQDIRSKAGNDGPKLSLFPATKTQTVGESFSVVITMNTNTDTVSAAELHLSYDPTAIQVLSFTPGAQLPVILVPETHSNGAIAVTLAAKPPTAFKGAGVLGVLTVKALTAKQSTISFTDATQVAALGKNTNALASKTDSIITGVAAITPTPKPLRPIRKF